MGQIGRHPYLAGVATLLLIFAVLAISGTEPNRRLSTAFGIAIFYSVIFAIYLGLAWLWRKLFRRAARSGAEIIPVAAHSDPAYPLPIPSAEVSGGPVLLSGNTPTYAFDPVLNRYVRTDIPGAVQEPRIAAPVQAKQNLVHRLGWPPKRSATFAIALSSAILVVLTWRLYTDPGWDESSTPKSFIVLFLAAPLLAPAVGGILVRSWVWVPAAAVAFAAGGVLGLWMIGFRATLNGEEQSLVWPAVFFFPGIPAFAAALGSSIRLIRSLDTAAIGILVLVVSFVWAFTGLCYGFAMVNYG